MMEAVLTQMAAAAQMGYSGGEMFWIGAVLLACTALYAIPRTSVLGALLLTGCLGGRLRFKLTQATRCSNAHSR
jgi:hypothetical protein